MSLKEKAIMGAMGPALGIINALAPDLNKIKPLNPVACFVHDNIQTLLMNDDSDEMSHLLSKIAIAQANDDPEYVLAKLLCFYENFRVFYGNSLKSSICETNSSMEH